MKTRIKYLHTDKTYNVFKAVEINRKYPWTTVKRFSEGKFVYRHSGTFEEAIKLTETL